MLDCLGDASPWGGALETARDLRWQVEPVLDARALPGGMGEDAVFDDFWNEFRERSAHWKEGEIDGIFFVLHGAMVTPSYPDLEGEFLRRVREIPALKQAPLAAVLDLHANVTPEMARHASALGGYRENPHTDARETAVRAARLLDRQMAGGPPMRTAWRGTPIVWPPAGTGTAASPMADLEAIARQMEREAPGVLDVSVCAGFSFADMPQAGVSFCLVHTPECDPEPLLDRLAAAAWELREAGKVHGDPRGSSAGIHPRRIRRPGGARGGIG